MDKEKIKQKIKELEALLEETEGKADPEFKLKLNTGSYRYGEFGHIVTGGSEVYSRLFNCFPKGEQAEIASKRKSAQNELLQMAFILNGDWKLDFSNNSKKYYVCYDHKLSNFVQDYNLNSSFSFVYFKIEPLKYFLATASDNLKAYIKGELQ